MPTELHAELVADVQAELGEGPVWHAAEEQLYWVDINKGELHAFDPQTQRDRVVHTFNEPLGCAVPRASGGFLVAVGVRVAVFDPATRSVTTVAQPAHAEGVSRFNDGKCDPAGRLWVGTLGAAGASKLWRLNPDRSMHAMSTGVTCSNGLAWSADGRTMYFVDTPTREIAAFDCTAETGLIAKRRVAVTIPAVDGVPDGMAIDAEDNLWVGYWGGGCVVCWDPRRGRELRRIVVPAARATSCAFGGPQLDRLYITTARAVQDPDAMQREPRAGGLFMVDPGVTGARVPTFAG